MKKQDVINLVKFKMSNDDASFRNQVYQIAKEFDENGDSSVAQYLLSLIRDVDTLKLQDLEYGDFKFLHKDKRTPTSILYPDQLISELTAVARSINRKNGLHRFLFAGKPGTGKTEACRHIARLTNRSLLVVNIEELIDSHLGQTSKNIISLFEEINKVIFEGVIILFDEIDSLVMDRINENDLREMGRATSTFLRQLDDLDNNVVVIGTTNLLNALDDALKRRFDAVISFDKYSADDLYEIANQYLVELRSDFDDFQIDSRLLNKIIKLSKPLPNPGDLKNFIKLSVSFSNGGYDYLRILMDRLCPNVNKDDVVELKKLGFTLNEIQKLTSVSKSSASRMINNWRNDNA